MTQHRCLFRTRFCAMNCNWVWLQVS